MTAPIKPISELHPGDVIAAFLQPDGSVLAVRGGPLVVAAAEPTGGQWEGVAQIKISSTNRNRAARYSNGATHAVLAP